MKHETHLPTQQAEAEEKIWIPDADEDGLREKDHQPASTRWPQKTGSLTKEPVAKPQFGPKSLPHPKDDASSGTPGKLALPDSDFSKIAYADSNMVDFRKTEPALRSSNLDRKANLATGSKAKRLLKRREFQRVSREGKRHVGKFLCIDIRRASSLRLGISVSSRFGTSPERNRFKRLVREAFRQNAASLPNIEMNVLPRKLAKGASFQSIRDEMLQLCLH